MATTPDPPATLARALADVTGDGIDLRPLTTVAWFRLAPGAAGGQAQLDTTADSIAYSAFGTPYLDVVVDSGAVSAFESAVDATGVTVNGLAAGQRGYLTAGTIDQFRDAVAALETAIDTRITEFQQQVTALDAGGGAVAGKAASVIVGRLNQFIAGLQGWHDRLHASGAALSSIIADAGTSLQGFRTNVSGQWSKATGAGLRGNIRTAIATAVADVVAYLTSQGIVAGAAGYQLDQMNPANNPGSTQTQQQYQTAADAKIQAALASYPGGDLRLQSTWDAINAQVTASVSGLVNDLDSAAASSGATLDTAYRRLGDALANWTGDPAAAGSQAPPPGANGPVAAFAPANGGANGPGAGFGPPTTNVFSVAGNGPGGGATTNASDVGSGPADASGSATGTPPGAEAGFGVNTFAAGPAGRIAFGPSFAADTAPADGAASSFADAGFGPAAFLPGATSVGATSDVATGLTSDGATSGGAAPGGATPDGATPDGATPDGAASDGAASDGGTSIGAPAIGTRSAGGSSTANGRDTAGGRGAGSGQPPLGSGGDATDDHAAIGRQSGPGSSHRLKDRDLAPMFAPSQLSPGAERPPAPVVTETPVLSASMRGPMWPPMSGVPGGRRRRGERVTWLEGDDAVWGARAHAGSGVVGRTPAAVAAAAAAVGVGASADEVAGVDSGVVGRPPGAPATATPHSA